MTLQQRFPTLFNQPHSGQWLTEQESVRTPNTVAAYGFSLVDYFRFCDIQGIDPPNAERPAITAYVQDLYTRSKSATQAMPGQRLGDVRSTTDEGLAHATVRLRLATIRLYYEYLTEEKIRATNPVKAGVHVRGKRFDKARRGWVARHEKEPWLPDAKQWKAILDAASTDSIRNRFMLALAYDAGLRRGELCALEIGDIDPSEQVIRLRGITTKTGRGREVPYSQATGELYTAYLKHRRNLSQAPGPLFLSESRRNQGKPITLWTWSKTVQALGKRAGLPLLTTHTLRHLRLTDLAKAKWEMFEIAAFAGHSDPAVTMIYVHLSGREMGERFRQTLDSMQDQGPEITKTPLL